MKSYTDLEQSKKLAEILPIESADIYYFLDPTPAGNIYYIVTPQIDFGVKTKEPEYNKGDIPAWSLAALLQVLPLGIYDEFDGCDYELEIDMIDKMPRYIRLGDIYHSKFPYDFEKDTLLDNVVESIIWLNDNNYFEL